MLRKNIGSGSVPMSNVSALCIHGLFILIRSSQWVVSRAWPLVKAWSTLVEGGKEWYRLPVKLTLELVLANQKQNKLLCLWTIQLTKWAVKVPYLLLLKCSMVKVNGVLPGRTKCLSKTPLPGFSFYETSLHF